MMNCYWLQILPTGSNSGSIWALPNIWVLATPLAALLVAWLTYQYALKKMRHETRAQLQRLKYERKLAALEACWKLLLHTTEVENGRNILTWQKAEGTTTWYVNKAQAQGFVEALANYFYGSGLGIYLPTDIKAALFEYRNLLYGFLLAEKQNTAAIIEVNNPDMAARLQALHQQLVQLLKTETEHIEKVKES